MPNRATHATNIVASILDCGLNKSRYNVSVGSSTTPSVTYSYGLMKLELGGVENTLSLFDGLAKHLL